MKKLFFLCVAFAGIVQLACGQGSRKSPHETVSNADISVTYGRPFAKGREIFGKLEKYGQVWRTGADEATEITFKRDMTFAGKSITKGTYTLFTIPGETQWTIILNSKLGEWGAYGYDKIKDKNVLESKVSSTKLTTKVEQFTIALSSSAVVLSWDNVEVSIPIK
ncbi:MAG: DUF2911 domain-containing protein [Bacteroidetes bacterium]|nr:MAG: DUF2911 domain-containing protein [Bacteroidota bacterium]